MKLLLVRSHTNSTIRVPLDALGRKSVDSEVVYEWVKRHYPGWVYFGYYHEESDSC